MEKTGRNSNIEIIRIISMILIVAHHYALHGFVNIELTYSINKYIVEVLSLGGKFGVSCFILISGYYMCISKITDSKIIKLISEVVFYSVTITAIFFLGNLSLEPVSFVKLLLSFFPIGREEYWFMTCYILLLLMSPILNMSISMMEKVFHERIIIAAVILWSIMPTFFKINYGVNNLCWFVVLYFVGSYIRKYVDMEKHNAKKHLMVSGMLYLLLILSCVLIILLSEYCHSGWGVHSRFLMKLNSPLVLLSSVELLIGMIKLKGRNVKWINVMASGTLGVYLIHDNRLVRDFLWNTLRNAKFYFSDRLLFHAIISIIGVYIVCTIIDLLRQIIFEKWFMIFVNRNLPLFKTAIQNGFSILNRKIKSIGKWYYG